ncbi:DUF559 domain-containing protein [Blastococcus sp. SYSU D00813]
MPTRLTGPATRARAREAGIGDDELRRRDVVRMSRDTYLPKATAADLGARIEAVVMTAPPGAVVSHGTAAVLWDVEIPLQPTDVRIHITVSTGSAVRGRADRAIHRSPLTAGEVTSRRRFRVTTPARTWRDLAAVLAEAPLLAVADQMLQRHGTADDLRRQLELRPSGRGAARARAVLPLADQRAGSPMESVLRWLLHAARLPAPVLQHVVHDDRGFVGQVDMAWPDRRVLVEFDGEVHRERDVFVRDLRRQNGLVLAGWTILRFSSADVLGRPEAVVAAIRAALR